jgi:O-antigen/teichoic acid export membrane protein
MITFLRNKLSNLTSDKKFSEIFTGSIWALGARVIATALGLAVNIIIARHYGPELVGIVAVINSYLMLATIFTVLGTNTSILRLIPEHLFKYSPTSAFRIYQKTQFMVIAVSVVTGTLLFYEAHFIADKIFSKPYLSSYFQLSAVFVVFKSLAILNDQAVRAIKFIKVFSFMQLLPSLSNLILLGTFAVFFFSKDNPIYAHLLSFAVTAIVGWIIMEFAFKRKMAPEDQVKLVPASTILFTSLPMLMTQTMNFAMAQTGVIILGIYKTDAEVGYYAIAVKLATLTGFILSACNAMTGPKFSELFHSGNKSELFYVAKKSAKLIFWTTMPLLIVLVITGRPILGYIFGREFVAAYPAMLILVIGQFVNSASGSTGMFMNMVGHQKGFRNIIIFAAFINISFCFVTIPYWGMVGAAIASTTSIIFWNLITLIFIKKKYGKFIGYFPLKMKVSKTNG